LILEFSTKIFLEKEMSKPSVLGLVGGESMDIWENIAPMHLLTDTWFLGLLVIFMLLTLRSLQEWKCKTCNIRKEMSQYGYNHFKITIHNKYVNICYANEFFVEFNNYIC
jgi:hypothetical protein